MLGMKKREVKEWEAAAQENVQRQHEVAAELQQKIEELEEVWERWNALENERRELLDRIPAPGNEYRPTEEYTRLKELAEVESVFNGYTELRCGIPGSVLGGVATVIGAREAHRKKVAFVESEKKNPPKPSNPDAQRFTFDANVDPRKVRFREVKRYGPGGITPPDGWYGPLDPHDNPRLRGEGR